MLNPKLINCIEGNANTPISSDNTEDNICDPLATTGTTDNTGNEIGNILYQNIVVIGEKTGEFFIGIYMFFIIICFLYSLSIDWK